MAVAAGRPNEATTSMSHTEQGEEWKRGGVLCSQNVPGVADSSRLVEECTAALWLFLVRGHALNLS